MYSSKVWRNYFGLSHLKVHSDAPGQDSVGSMKVKQDSYWIVPGNRQIYTEGEREWCELGATPEA